MCNLVCKKTIPYREQTYMLLSFLSDCNPLVLYMMTLVSQDNGLQLREQCFQYKLSGTTMIRKALIKNHAMQNQQDICTITT